MRKSTLPVFALCLLFLYAEAPASAQTWHDVMKEVSASLHEGRAEEAKKLLYFGRDQAWQSGSWEGSLKAGLGFATLGQDVDARQSYAVARDFASKQGSWQGVLYAGQGFAAVGEEKEARNAYSLARDLARDQGSWKGVLESGRAFGSLGDVKEAETSYRITKMLATKQRAVRQFERSIKFPTPTLLKQRDLLRIEPGIASSWSISDDGKTIVLQLRQGIQCFNYSFVDARTVVTSLNENRRLKSLGIASVEEVDTNRVKIEMAGTFHDALQKLAQPEASIQCLP